MKRRGFLKLITAVPFLGLFKKKEPTSKEGAEALADFCLPILTPPEVKWFSPTTGASSDGPAGYYDGKWIWI